MANETILIVDADTKSQKVLEVSFKKAGYRVVMTDAPAHARKLVEDVAPDIVISDTQFGPDQGTGFEFLADIKSGDFKSVPFIFLTEERALPQKMKGFELGADDYLTKPIYIKEVTTRVQLLLQKRAKEQLTEDDVEELEGNLADITMIDLLQTIEEELRSGTIHLTRENQSAVIYFREGNILDAICGKLQGEEAIYRLMLWPDGVFVLRYHEQVRRIDRIEKDSGALLLEGIRRLDQYNELLDELPTLNRVFEADYDAVSAVRDQLPDEVGRILRLFDGLRSIRDVADGSPVDDVTSLQIVRKLIEDAFIVDVTPAVRGSERPSRSNLAAWLDGVRSGEEPRSHVISREDTSPKFGSSIAEMVEKRSTEQSEAVRETLENANPNGRETRDTDPFGSRIQAEVKPHRTTLPLGGGFEDADDWDDESFRRSGRRNTALQWERPRSDWNVKLDAVQPASAIEEIENDERRRQEEEAKQLSSAQRESTLRFAPAQSRNLGENEELLRQIEEDERLRRDEEARRLQAQIIAGADAIVPRRSTDELPTQSRTPEPVEEVKKTDHLKIPPPRNRPSTPLSSPAVQLDEGWAALAPSDAHGDAVSEADVFDDSDEVGRVDPPAPAAGEERSERKTLDLMPKTNLSRLTEPSSPEGDVDPGELFASIGHEETSPSADDDELDSMQSLEIEVIEVLPTVERQARDNELVRASYDLSLRRTITPNEVDGRPESVARRPTMELHAPNFGQGAEGKFFSADSGEFEFEEKRAGNGALWVLAALIGLAGVMVIMLIQDKPDPVVTEPPVRNVAQNTTSAPPAETIAVETNGIEEATIAGTVYAMSSGQEATKLARIMSGADLAPDMGQASADAGGIADAPPVEEPPVEKPPVERPPVEKPPIEKPVKPVEKISGATGAAISKAERLVKRGDYDEALGMLRQLTQAAPNNQKVAYLHGLAAFSSNRNGEAVTHLARAERLGYRSAPLYLDLAAAYQLDGQQSQAKWAYEKFLSIQPNGRQADQVRTILSTRF